MKILIILLLSINTFAQSDLYQLLKLKDTNFVKVSSLYKSLKSHAMKEDKDKFCKLIDTNISSLEDIYQDDFKLNQALISEDQEHTLEYAQKIKDNSRSDLFSFHIYSDLCKENRIRPVARHILTIERSITNTEILRRSHLLFMQIYQGLK